MSRRPHLPLIAAACWIAIGAACAGPPPRLSEYLGSSSESQKQGLDQVSRPLDIGLLLLNDSQGQGAAPAINQESLAKLTEWGKQALDQVADFRVVKVLDGAQIRPTHDRVQFIRLAQEQGLNHLLVVVQSGTETVAPAALPLGGPEAITLSGTEVKNYSLSEFALLEGKTGQTVLEVSGRGWATLEAPTVSLQSNQYPVVRRSIHSAPIFPSEANARETLRSVAAADAFEQALMHLQQAWPKARMTSAPN